MHSAIVGTTLVEALEEADDGVADEVAESDSEAVTPRYLLAPIVIVGARSLVSSHRLTMHITFVVSVSRRVSYLSLRFLPSASRAVQTSASSPF